MDRISVVEQPQGDYSHQGNTSIATSGYYTASYADFISAFHLALQKWKSETAFDSDIEAITSHSSFKDIVRLQERAVPLILNELRSGPSLLVYALEDITGEQPYPPNALGNIRAMADSWLLWSERDAAAAA